ncbi:hypothetical protein GOV14_05775 [Candidatus Pacearchaeota archaeon]|nr:hypothetical protein [Candidatus Pacearchaeota archaeon]
MRFAIIYSKANEAGPLIVEELKKLAFLPQVPIIEIPKKQVIFLQDINDKIYPELRDIEFLIFASTHRSVQGNPSLSLHAPGNWRSADLGGESGKICMTSCFVLKHLFQELNKNAQLVPEVKEKYEVTLEVTHHGPKTNIPCAFIELGSSEEYWKDSSAAKVLAKTIISLQEFDPKSKKDVWRPCIAVGGPHYAPVFNKVQLNSIYAVGHIVPQYALPLTENMLIESEEKTKEQVHSVIIDWKGCGKSAGRQNTVNVIEKQGLKWLKTKQIEK